MGYPKEQDRASGYPNSKQRITGLFALSSEGELLPAFLIIKHSKSSLSKPDQTTMTVKRNLSKQKGFRREDGWELKIWTKQLSIKNKNNTYEYATHKCWYLIHERDRHVITSQYKAWNDTVRMAMWCELIGKLLSLDRNNLFVWMNNCSTHTSDVMKEVYSNCFIDPSFYPPNMTAILQPLDLLLNAPLKQLIRRNRETILID